MLLSPQNISSAKAVEAKTTPTHVMSESISMIYGCASMKSPNHPNEDRVSIWSDLREVWNYVLPHRLSAILVADGHGGSACVSFIRNHLPSHLLNVVRFYYEQSSTLSFPEMLTMCFETLELAWTKYVESAIRAGESADSPALTSGACATLLLVYNGTVITANIGDLRAVVRQSSGRVQLMTEDHRVANPGEAHRIIENGGFIARNRVLGVLEPTRTFGDLDEKQSTNAGVIIARPFCFEFPLPKASILNRSHLVRSITKLRSKAMTQTGFIKLPSEIILQAALVNDYDESRLTNPLVWSNSIRTRASHESRSQASNSGSSAISLNPHLRKSRTVQSRLVAAANGILKRVSGSNSSSSSNSSVSVNQYESDPKTEVGLSFSVEEAVAIAPHIPITMAIVASDGVWDVLGIRAVTELATYAFAITGDPMLAAHYICKQAQLAGSEDDVSAALFIIERVADVTDVPSKQ